MKIQSKILLGFSSFIFLFFLISLIFFQSNREMDLIFSNLSSRSLPMGSVLHNIRYAAASMNRVANEMVVITGEFRALGEDNDWGDVDQEITEEELEFANALELMTTNLAGYVSMVKEFFPDEKMFVENLQLYAGRLEDACRELIDMAKAGHSSSDILEQKDVVEDIEKKFDEHIRLILAHENKEISEKVESVHQQVAHTAQLLFLGSILIVIIALILSIVISRRLARPILKLQEAADKISRGRFETRIDVTSRDEVGALSNIFNKMVAEIEQLTNNMTDMVEKRTADLTRSNHSLQQEVKERERAEESARQTASRMNNIFNNAIPLCITNTDFEIIQANDAYYQLFGGEENQLQPVKCYESRPGPSCHTDQCPLARIIAGRNEITCEARKEEAGHTHHFIVVGRPFRNADGEVVGIIESFQDITARKAAEQLLADEKERLAVTLQSIGDGVITTDTDGNILLLNNIAQEMTGWSQQEAYGKPLEEVFHIISERDRNRHENPVEKVLRTGQIIELANHTILIARNGRELFIADSGAPIFNSKSQIIGVVLVFRDVTEKQLIEKEMAKMAKLQSIGVLAGGIAHDFNNILTALVGNITLAKMYCEPGDKIYDRLATSEDAIFRARDLTQQLLTFSKGGTPVRKVSSIGKLITDTASFSLRGSKNISDLCLADDLYLADVDSGQINQVLSNLIINADQAMTEAGKITITAENQTIKPDDILPLTPGLYVKISVRDQGPGIPKDILPQIFDPYFTTKDDGSGLGLASVFSIIANHEGHVTVDTILGKGTTFTIYLPASAEDRDEEQITEDRIVRGTGKILVMDDDREVREMISEVLTTLGYTPTMTVEGNDALASFQEAIESNRPFAAVILDLTIPGGMGGKETMRRLLEVDPLVKVIVSSGYSSDPVMANYEEYGFKAVVTKPYKVVELSQILHRVIMGRG